MPLDNPPSKPFLGHFFGGRLSSSKIGSFRFNRRGSLNALFGGPGVQGGLLSVHVALQARAVQLLVHFGDALFDRLMVAALAYKNDFRYNIA